MTPTATERLRSATRPWHDTLETSAFATALLAGTLPLDRYIGQLTAYRVVLAALETELSRTTCADVARVWSPDLAKGALIDRDLRYFGVAGDEAGGPAEGGRPVAGDAGRADGARSSAGQGRPQTGGTQALAADAPPREADTRPRPDHSRPSAAAPLALAVGAAQSFAEDIRWAAGVEPCELLGFLYVLEGSTLGALFLRPYLCAAHGLDGTAGTDYYASGDRARWVRLTGRLDENLTDAETLDRVIAAADRAYRHTAAVTEALSRGLTEAGS